MNTTKTKGGSTSERERGSRDRTIASCLHYVDVFGVRRGTKRGSVREGSIECSMVLRAIWRPRLNDLVLNSFWSTDSRRIAFVLPRVERRTAWVILQRLGSTFTLARTPCLVRIRVQMWTRFQVVRCSVQGQTNAVRHELVLQR